MSSQCNDGSAWVRIYRSFNGGQTWTYSEVVDPNDYCLREVYRGDAYGDVVYIGGVGQGVGGYWDGVIYVSNDGGITWQRDWSHNELTGPNASSAISSFATPKLGSSAGDVWYATVERRSITFPVAYPYLIISRILNDPIILLNGKIRWLQLSNNLSYLTGSKPFITLLIGVNS